MGTRSRKRLRVEKQQEEPEVVKNVKDVKKS
jgi:hypothetical protein